MTAPRPRRASVALLFLTALALAAPGGANAQVEADSPAPPPLATSPSQTVPPPGYRVSAKRARELAQRLPAVRAVLHRPGITFGAYFLPGFDWQVLYWRGDDNIVEVDVDGRSGAIEHLWTGPQASSYLARGHFGGAVDSWWVWALLCVLFVAPFVDPRRPLRLLHLDLLVLLSFGISHLLFNQGHIFASVPLTYPPLVYLLVRMLIAGMRRAPARSPGPLVPVVPMAWLAIALVALVGLRATFDATSGRVIDVGYASVVGADRIGHDQQLYVDNNVHGDTYGPVTYLAYVPIERIVPFNGHWDAVPTARVAAILFDLLTIAGLLVLGIRLRAGPAGRRLGLALAYAWAAFPYTLFALAVNTNDALVAALLTWALVAFASPAARGALVGLGAAAKFAPLALAPLFLAGRGDRRPRDVLVCAAALVGVVALAVGLYLPDGGLREFWNATLGFQIGRTSPFSLWGLHPSLVPVQKALEVGVVLLAVAVAFVPRRRGPVRVAALGAAVLVALQMTAMHWFYFYLLWLAPYVLVALLAAHPTSGAQDPPPQEPAEAGEPDRAPALAGV